MKRVTGEVSERFMEPVLKTNALPRLYKAQSRMVTGFLFLLSGGGKKILSYFLSFFPEIDGS